MNVLFVITVVLALFVLKACAGNKTQINPLKTLLEERIINGVDARAGTFPWALYFVASNDDPNGSTFCAGTLVTTRSALTAAHCCRGFFRFQLVIGSIKLFASGIARTALFCKMHDQYVQKTKRNDLALLRFETIPTTKNAKPIALTRGRELGRSFENVQAVVCGWGEQLNGLLSRNLKYAYMKVIPNKQCQKFATNIFSTTMCAMGANRKGPCRYDSGAPLSHYTKDRGAILLGITSWGWAQCGTQPSGFMRITKYISWINKYK